jgi:integrase
MDRAAPKSRSESTMLMTKSLVSNHVLPVLGAARLSSVQVEDIEEWLHARSDLSKSTLVKLRAILAQAFDFGVKRRHVSWNPARAAELPHEADQTREPRALSPSEARSLMNVANDHRLGAWVTVSMTLGLRPGEVSGLTWDRVDFEAGTMTVSQALGWPNPKTPTIKPTKTGNSRTLALPGVTIDALRLHRKRQAEERLLMGEKWPAKWADLVFVSERGTPLNPSGLRKIIQRFAVEAGIEGTVTPYDCRHSATTIMAAAGMSADRLADMLGHKDTRMVWGHYRHRDGMVVETAADYWTDAR